MTKYESIIQDEIDNLPLGFAENLDPQLQRVVAVLYLHGFFILRADEAEPYVGPTADLYGEVGHPSVMFSAPKTNKLMQSYHEIIGNVTDPHDPRLVAVTSQIVRANIEEQYRLLALLEEFYHGREVDFYTRLIVENLDIEGAYLKPQGASVRPLLDKEGQERRAKDYTAELLAFTDFLVRKLEEKP